MRRPLARSVSFVGAAVFAAWAVTPSPSAAPRAEAAAPPGIDAALAQVRFVPNHGQWHGDVRFAALGDTAGWLHDDGFTLRFERWREPSVPADAAPREHGGCVVRTRFLDAAVPRVVPGRERAERQHFFLGNEPQRWRSDVPAFDSVLFEGVHPGIDVLFRQLPAGRRGAFEYDLVLAPGAELDSFVAECEGVEALSIDADGRLCARIATPDGVAELVQEAPIAWQETPHGRKPLEVAFRLLGTRRYGFTAIDRDASLPTVVDPGVVWGTYLGGGASDSVNDLHWQPGVGIWVAGWAGSTDFPTTTGAYRTVGGADAFVARLAENGQSLVFATYLGGTAGEEVRGIALGPGNTATVVGFTGSADFPITPGAQQPGYGGGSQFIDIGDGFVTRLAANGASLLGSTYLGGATDDVAEKVVVAPDGDAIVVGWTFSTDFPITPGAWRTAFASIPSVDSDGFVVRLAGDLQSLDFATFVGGLWSDQMLAIDLEPVTGDIVVAGWTLSPNYPTTFNAYRSTSGGDNEAVITRLSGNGATAVFSTYLGGVDAESAHDVAFDVDGSVWVAGRANSPNFPTTLNAPQRFNAGDYDGFVAHLPANGQSLLFSTLLGGPGADSVRAIDVLPNGVVVVGETASGFPLTAAPIQDQFAGGSLDGFLSYLTAGGTTLTYSTYLGGSGQDFLTGVQLDASGMAIVGGWTFSTDFPIAPAALQATHAGVQDGAVVKIDLLSELGQGLTVASPPVTSPTFVAPGRHTLLAAQLGNETGRTLSIDALRLLVAGGAAPQSVRELRVWLERDGTAPALVGGVDALSVGSAEVALALSGADLPAATDAVLRVDAVLDADPQGATVELACAIADRDAWTLRAEGAGAGPEVRVLGNGRAVGPVLVHGTLPGDVDGDGATSIFDLRALLSLLGDVAPGIDVDGDGVLTSADVALMREVVLGRPVLVAAPTAVSPGQWFTLRGAFAVGELLEATLGGRSLLPGRVTPREITLRVPAESSLGTQTLQVLLGGRTVVSVPLLVQ